MLGCPSVPPASVAPPQPKPVTALVVPMLFPADPAVLSVTVTVDPLAAAVKAALSVPFKPMALAKLVASSVVVPPVAKCVLSVVPFEPLASVEPFQVYLLPAFDVRLMLLPPLPAVLAVTVTVVPLELAVTAADVQRLIAFLRFVARFVVLESVAKVPAVELPHAFEPIVPALTPLPHEKMLLAFDAKTEKAETLVDPLVVFVTVTVLVLALALTPAAAGHRPIAVARLEAKVVVLELVANVPLVALEQEFVPAELPVTLPHEKPARLPPVPTERKAPGFVSVIVT